MNAANERTPGDAALRRQLLALAPPETDGPETADRRAALRAALDALRPRTGRWYGARWWRACPTGSWRPSTTGRSRTCATGAAAPNACWPTC